MKNIEIKSFLDFQFPSAPEFSPDGKTVAFVLQQPSLEENKYNGNIWLLDVETRKYRQLTNGGDGKSFLWTKQGTILFKAKRDSSLKKEGENASAWYEISPDGGEAKLAFTLPVSPGKLKAVDDDRFIFTALYRNKNEENDTRTPADCDVLEETPFWSNGSSEFTSGRRSRLYVYTRSTGELKAITGPWFDTAGYSVRGNQVLYKGTEWRNAIDRLYHSGFWLYDLDSEETRMVMEPGTIRTEAFALWEDETALVTASDDQQYGRMRFVDFYNMALSTGALEFLAKHEAGASGNSVGTDARLGGGTVGKVVDDRFYYITTLGDCGYLKYVDKSGYISEKLTPDGAADSFDIHGENLIVCGLYGQKLPELYLNGEQVTFFNESWYQEHTVSVPEYHSFNASDGFEIHGWIMKPVGYVSGKKYPAILHIHGGPRTTFCDIFHHEMQVWANAGYFVFFCNPRGSDGRGNEFGYIQNKYGTVEYQNLMEFTDEVLKAYPDIDSKKVGVTGGSYGGFMTNWIIGHTNRFAAAVSQRSISNWVTFEHTSDIGFYFAHTHQGATTRENVEQLWWHSPLQYAPQCTTPTLFIHADQDFRCWTVEGISMFTALKNSGCEAKMVLFHGENHELSRSGKPRNRIRRMEEILAWMDKYLK